MAGFSLLLIYSTIITHSQMIIIIPIDESMQLIVLLGHLHIKKQKTIATAIHSIPFPSLSFQHRRRSWRVFSRCCSLVTLWLTMAAGYHAAGGWGNGLGEGEVKEGKKEGGSEEPPLADQPLLVNVAGDWLRSLSPEACGVLPTHRT